MAEDVVVEPTHPERVLQGHHARVAENLELLAQAVRAGDQPAASKAWEVFVMLLTNHLVAEETLLFPMADHSHHAVVERLRAEHARIRTATAELGAAIDGNRMKAGAAEALIEALAAHTKREEETIYPWAELNLGASEWARVLVELNRVRTPPAHVVPPPPKVPRVPKPPP